MSAQLVSNLDRDENGERIPMPAERAETLANTPQFAESLELLLLRDSRDGQLWERVAEGKTVEPRRDHPLEVVERGPWLGTFHESPLASGIIRGKRA